MPTKRGRFPRVKGRGQVVRDALLGTALELLARNGYGSLRMDEVAERAGVNKTTLYRRFPSKAKLVLAVVHAQWTQAKEVPNTGSFEDDFVLHTKQTRLASSLATRAIERMVLFDHEDPEAKQIASQLRAKVAGRRAQIVTAAIKRGELAKDTDSALLAEAIYGAMILRRISGKPVDEPYQRRLIRMILRGAGMRGMRV